jgi:hypothetical protein
MRMAMKELCSYVKAKQSENARIHRTTVTQGEYCSGLTIKEYNSMKVSVKRVGSKSRSYSHTKLWKYNNEGINLQK